jgi:hypothetical protein
VQVETCILQSVARKIVNNHSNRQNKPVLELNAQQFLVREGGEYSNHYPIKR